MPSSFNVSPSQIVKRNSRSSVIYFLYWSLIFLRKAKITLCMIMCLMIIRRGKKVMLMLLISWVVEAMSYPSCSEIWKHQIRVSPRLQTLQTIKKGMCSFTWCPSRDWKKVIHSQPGLSTMPLVRLKYQTMTSFTYFEAYSE